LALQISSSTGFDRFPLDKSAKGVPNADICRTHILFEWLPPGGGLFMEMKQERDGGCADNRRQIIGAKEKPGGDTEGVQIFRFCLQ
jgi:hypothetical protein